MSDSEQISLEAQPEQVLLFTVGREAHAIELDRIRIVQRADDIRPLPQSPENVIGMLELEGEAVPVVDLAAVLGLPADDVREHVLIYSSGKGLVGYLVGEAHGVGAATRSPLPQTLRRSDSCLVALARHSGGTAYLLDLEQAVPKTRKAASSRETSGG